MKSSDFIKENIAITAQEVEKDHEVQMARSQCYHAAEAAMQLHKLLKQIDEQQGIEGWVASKITLASDYLTTVRDYLAYEQMSGGVDESTGGMGAGSVAVGSPAVSSGGFKKGIKRR
jgi:hypothetical protein